VRRISCPRCHRPLVRIDYEGEALIGCPDCNCWGRPGDVSLQLLLLEEDLKTLRVALDHNGGSGSAVEALACEDVHENNRRGMIKLWLRHKAVTV